MNRIACRYAVLKFVPYPETGEFANVGVIMVAPKENRLLFMLETRHTKRLNGFFRHLDVDVYKAAIGNYHEELAFLEQQVSDGKLSACDAFGLMVRPREAILSFGEPRGALLEHDPKTALNKIYHDQVYQEFAKKPDYEAKLKSRVKCMVKELRLQRPFVERHITHKGFKVNFDLAQLENDTVTRVIKPLSFLHLEAKQIFSHADIWLAKLKRLDQFNLMPRDTIFPIEVSAANDDAAEAIELVTRDLQNVGDVVDAESDIAIKDFANR
jgi:Protein of unknown function (DUF3037).